MYRIGSCTVIYDPDESVISNIESYSKYMDLCVVVDNSPEKNAVSKYFESNSSYIYINMHGNQGIAAAINAGIAYLHLKNIEVALTMDQDSVFPTDKYSEIICLIEKYMDTYSLIGLNVNEVDASKEIVEVPYWITSGNFVKISDFNRVGKMNEDLFIDYVDIVFHIRLEILLRFIF